MTKMNADGEPADTAPRVPQVVVSGWVPQRKTFSHLSFAVMKSHQPEIPRVLADNREYRVKKCLPLLVRALLIRRAGADPIYIRSWTLGSAYTRVAGWLGGSLIVWVNDYIFLLDTFTLSFTFLFEHIRQQRTNISKTAAQ